MNSHRKLGNFTPKTSEKSWNFEIQENLSFVISFEKNEVVNVISRSEERNQLETHRWRPFNVANCPPVNCISTKTNVKSSLIENFTDFSCDSEQKLENISAQITQSYSSKNLNSLSQFGALRIKKILTGNMDSFSHDSKQKLAKFSAKIALPYFLKN